MTINLRELQILETTLRDGSYVIDFQFSAEDTGRLAGFLDHLGVRLIEIGHGVGINASPNKGLAAATDVDYVRAAREAVSDRARIGMFCIPGIAALDDLRVCADAGLQFVRVGANVDDVESTRSFVSLARDLGLTVFANFMKSYVMEPEEFADVARRSVEFGSECIYVVDSAGGMVPDDVRRYFTALREAVDVPLGFHGHNNLQLAVANSLAAVECGASIVDTTLLGMGRSSGNAPTEVMIPLMQRCHGACEDLDPLMFVELAERAIAPLLKNRWDNSEKTALGLAQVHSMYTGAIRKAAASEGRNYYSVIAEVGRRDRLNLPQDVLSEALRMSAAEETVARDVGRVCLVPCPTDTSDVTGILTAARKIAAPVEVVVVDDDAACSVEVDAHAIRLACMPEQASELERAAALQNVRILFMAGSPARPIAAH